MAFTFPAEYMHPPLMAIGDSMYQGVRSLTMSGPLFRYSPPAQVARALDLDFDRFSYPDPKRPIIIDMEAFIRALPNLGAIDRILAESAQYWLGASPPPSPSGRLAFENISVASMDISDLYAFDWTKRRKQAAALTVANASSIKGLASVKIPDGSIADAILGLNARFTLNPTNHPDLAEIQPVELVAMREPEILLVNIGSNEGLFNTAFEGQPTLNATVVQEVTKKYETLARKLKDVGPKTKKMIFNTLVLPSQVPNLMPEPEQITYQGILPGPSGYFDHYENRMGFGYGRMTGDQVAEQDKCVRDMNTNMMAVMGDILGDRAAFVDLAADMAHLNRKHEHRRDDNTIRIDYKRGGFLPCTHYISNMMLETAPPMLPCFDRYGMGGFCGLDGMHPSVVGYGRIAQSVLDQIDQESRRIDYSACYEEDTLLRDLPAGWTALMFLWRDIRRTIAKPETVDEESKAAVMKVAAQAIRR